jgi:hypothetical protein
MSESPEEWHEAASVTVTRLICQVLVTLTVLGASVLLVLTHPEYGAGIALVCGVVLGSWFTVPRDIGWGRRRARRSDSEE